MKPQQKKHDGHLIELQMQGDKLKLLIDSVDIPYGKLDDGMYFLKDFAYQPNKDLIELAESYLDHKAKAAKIAKDKKANEKGGKTS